VASPSARTRYTSAADTNHQENTRIYTERAVLYEQLCGFLRFRRPSRGPLDALFSTCPSVCACVRACVCTCPNRIIRRQHLRSAGCRQLFVPRHRRSMFGRRAFSVAGAAACNSLPDYLRDLSRSFDSFRRDLKTFLSSFYQRTQRTRGFAIMRCINLLLTLTLTLSGHVVNI